MRIDRHELAEWQAYGELEPFGPGQEDYRAGIVAAITHNAWYGKGDAKQPGDFFPSLKVPEPEQSDEDMRNAVIAFVLAHGGQVIEKSEVGSQKSEVGSQKSE